MDKQVYWLENVLIECNNLKFEKKLFVFAKNKTVILKEEYFSYPIGRYLFLVYREIQRLKSRQKNELSFPSSVWKVFANMSRSVCENSSSPLKIHSPLEKGSDNRWASHLLLIIKASWGRYERHKKTERFGDDSRQWYLMPPF